MSLIVAVLAEWLPLVAVGLLLVKLVMVFLKRRTLQELFKEFPGPKPEFFSGNTRELTGDYEGLMKMLELGEQYPGAYPAWTGPADAQLISVHASTAKAILSGSDPKDEFSYAMMRPWIGNGLLLSKGWKWDRNRRLLTPAFHVNILKNYVSVFSQCTRQLVGKWRSSSSASHELFHHISLLTLDSMMQCLFGYHSNCQNEETRHPYIQGVYDVSELIVQRIMNPLHHYDFIYYKTSNGRKFQKACDTIHDHSEAIIHDRRKLLQREKPSSRNVDFLDILLTAKDCDGVGLTEQEVRDEVDTFMFEGHDSTASTISWCLYNLAKHPACQDKCRAEILRVLGKNRDIGWEDVGKLEFTTQCIHESMRLYPAVPSVSRCLEKDVHLPDGRVVRKGVRVAVSLFAVQRDPEIWEEPHEYKPERFEHSANISAAYHLPFSIGPRNCIGQQFALTQVKVVICELLRHFQFDLDPEREAVPECLLILRSKNGLYLKVNDWR